MNINSRTWEAWITNLSESKDAVRLCNRDVPVDHLAVMVGERKEEGHGLAKRVPNKVASRVVDAWKAHYG